MRKKLSAGTVLLGFFWFISFAYWSLTIMLMLLRLLGAAESGYSYGWLFINGYFYPIALVELAVLVLVLVVFFLIKDEKLIKSWSKTAAVAIAFTYMPVVVMVVVGELYLSSF